jgi:hypothetical protein
MSKDVYQGKTYSYLIRDEKSTSLEKIASFRFQELLDGSCLRHSTLFSHTLSMSICKTKTCPAIH